MHERRWWRSDVGTELNNLALVLRDLGDFEGALVYLERGLAIAESSYGPDHPTIATLRANWMQLSGTESVAGASATGVLMSHSCPPEEQSLAPGQGMLRRFWRRRRAAER